MARTESTWEIGNALIGEGIVRPGGGRRTAKAVHRIVYDRTYIGLSTYAEGSGEVRVPQLASEQGGSTPTAAWIAN